jgi:hypothetical protein
VAYFRGIVCIRFRGQKKVPECLSEYGSMAWDFNQGLATQHEPVYLSCRI